MKGLLVLLFLIIVQVGNCQGGEDSFVTTPAVPFQCAQYDFIGEPPGPQGFSKDYFTGPNNVYQITAYGFNNDGTPAILYNKIDVTDELENGLGLLDDVGGSNEIDVFHFIQLDLFALKNTVTPPGSPASIWMLIGSAQCSTDEGFEIFGSNTLGSIGISLKKGLCSDATPFFKVPGFNTYRYISVRAVNDGTYQRSNVLISGIILTCPTPSPTYTPTYIPSYSPSYEPTFIPTAIPSYLPSVEPTYEPTPKFDKTEESTYRPARVSKTYSPTYSPTVCEPACKRRLVRTRAAVVCPRAKKIGTSACAVESTCPKNYKPIDCSCRLSQTPNDAYWALVNDFINPFDYNTCYCWWTSLREQPYLNKNAYQALVDVICEESSAFKYD